MRDGCVVMSHAFRGLCLNSHTVRSDAKHLCDAFLDCLRVWPNLGRGEYQRAIDIPHGVPPRSDLVHRFANEHRRVSTLPFWIARWEVTADVSSGYRPQQRVRNRVEKHVAIRMARQSAVMGQHDSPDP